jgi:hypothetical protein
LQGAGAIEVDDRMIAVRIGERAVPSFVRLADLIVARAAAPFGYADLIPASSAAKHRPGWSPRISA